MKRIFANTLISFCDLDVAKRSKLGCFHRDTKIKLKIISLEVDGACDAQTIQKEQGHILRSMIDISPDETPAYAYPVRTRGSWSRITTFSTIVDMKLNLAITDAEFETHRVVFSNYFQFQYAQADHCNMFLSSI